MDKNISFTLKVWRQRGPKVKGAFETYQMKDIPGDTSFLEMLDILNEQLVNDNKEPIAFDHDCREGICGMCSLYVNGHPHGPATGATTCQLYMRRFKDGDTITVEPWRSAGFPVIRDLMVDRTAFDKIQQAGGYVSINTGGMPDANAIPIGKDIAEEAMDAAACIGCGACAGECVTDALSLCGKEMSVEEVLDQVLKDKVECLDGSCLLLIELLVVIYHSLFQQGDVAEGTYQIEVAECAEGEHLTTGYVQVTLCIVGILFHYLGSKLHDDVTVIDDGIEL